MADTSGPRGPPSQHAADELPVAAADVGGHQDADSAAEKSREQAHGASELQAELQDKAPQDGELPALRSAWQ